MTTLFFLLRHAAYDGMDEFLAGRSRVPLNCAGLRQAETLGERMRIEGLAAIFSSPTFRALQTAQIVAEHCAIGPVIVHPGLDEVDYGSWTGKSFRQLCGDPHWRRWNAERDAAATPAGERMADVKRRVSAFLQAACADFAGKSIALASHSEIIKSAVCQVLDLPASNSFRLAIDPASITLLEMDDAQATLLRLNDTVSIRNGQAEDDRCRNDLERTEQQVALGSGA